MKYVSVITGGGRGLGYYMAKKCINEGANVIISGRNEDTLKNAQKELGPTCKYIVFDVSEADKSNDFLLRCKSEFDGQIDSLISNAGVSLHENIYSNVTLKGFDTQFNTNLRGAYFLCQAFLTMKLEEKTENANLIIISSETGNQCYDIPYGMTKAATNTLVKALSRRVYKSGIRVNGIAQNPQNYVYR